MNATEHKDIYHVVTSGVEGLVSLESIMHLGQVAEVSKSTGFVEWAKVQPVVSG